MAKDYKNAGTTRKRPASGEGVPGWLWFAGGCALGFAVAMMLRISALAPVAAPASVPPPDAAADAGAADKPRFEFYKMLPKFEVVIPEQDRDVQRAGEVARVEKPGTYVLQAGSFRSFADADRLKATLALAGLESTIQQVTIDADETWYRVRLGPYTDLERLNQTKQRLADNGVQALVIRVGD